MMIAWISFIENYRIGETRCEEEENEEEEREETRSRRREGGEEETKELRVAG